HNILTRRPVTYQPDDLVLLDTQNLRLPITPKLRPRYCGPFRISHLVTPVTAHLLLPADWYVSPSFHERVVLLFHDLLIVAQVLFHFIVLLLLLPLVLVLPRSSSSHSFTLLLLPLPLPLCHGQLQALHRAPPPHGPPHLRCLRPFDLELQERYLHQLPQTRVAERSMHPGLDDVLPGEPPLALHGGEGKHSQRLPQQEEVGPSPARHIRNTTKHVKVESRQLVAEEPAASVQPLLALLLSLGLDLRTLPRPEQLRRAQLPKVIQPFVQVVHAVAGKLAAQLHAFCVGASLLVALQLPLMHGVEV
ncbi:unnamed protein product, partial [Closterium sp. NIES-54]